MKLGRVRLDYLTPGGSRAGLQGELPLADGRVRLEPFDGPDEAGVTLARVEAGIELLGLTVELKDVNLRDRFLANGYQSWSETRLVGPDDRLPGLRSVVGFLKPYSDYGWVDYPGRPGCFRSHWLTYTLSGGFTGGQANRGAGAAPAGAAPAGEAPAGEAPAGEVGPRGVSFLGSLNEDTAYTVFRVDYRAGSCRAEVDVEGMRPEPGQILFRVFHTEAEGGEGSPLLRAVGAYARRLGEVWKEELAWVWREAAVPGPEPGRLFPRPGRRPGGWNSWYNYYGRVTARDIRRETEALRSAGVAVDFVQIDDGWQAEVGDWLEASPRFLQGGGRSGVQVGGPASARTTGSGSGRSGAAGMADLARSIRDAGLEPGIWVAPLVASKRAEVFRRGWVMPWRAGWNPGWGSSIYALDLGRPEVADYIRRVGDTFQAWGYGLVKADFLYAAAVRPWGGRTRAQRMREAMRLLRRVMPGRLLGCGVPLSSAAGLVDFCRLGPDTTPKWEDGLLAFCRYRERPSTVTALRTILGRWFMNGTLFVLDPDVFILGPGSLTDTERRTLYDVTTTLGGLQTFSDSVADLPTELRDLVTRTFPLPDLEVLEVEEPEPQLYRIRFKQAGPAELLVNLSDRPRRGVAPHQTVRR